MLENINTKKRLENKNKVQERFSAKEEGTHDFYGKKKKNEKGRRNKYRLKNVA